MRRLSPKTLAVVDKANIAAAKAAVQPTVAPTVDPFARTARELELAAKGYQTYVAPTPYVDPRSARPSERAAYTTKPAVIVAEVGDTFGSLAQKSKVEEIEFIQANKDVTEIKADAVYNVPQIDITGGVGAGAGIGEDLWEGAKKAWEWLTPQGEFAGETFYEWAQALPGGDLGGGLQNIIKRGEESIRDFFLPDKETGVLPSGKPLASPVYTPPPTQAEYADFRKAEAEAAYRDREAQFMTGSLGITDIRDRPGYYGFYGTEQDLAAQAAGDFSQLYNPLYDPQPYVDPRGARPSEREAPESAEEALRQMWEDVYLDPANKGRGGGIVGWIEDRTGLTIDPETFFTEGASAEVLAAMLAEFRPDELNYLESQGIIVPVERYELPSGGVGGATYGGRYNYPAPAYYGGGGAAQTSYRQPATLGLVSWSI